MTTTKDSTDIFDTSLAGKRIKITSINDPWTQLKPGTEGIIKYTFENVGTKCIAVSWFSGSSLSLIDGIDQYEILE